MLRGVIPHGWDKLYAQAAGVKSAPVIFNRESPVLFSTIRFETLSLDSQRGAPCVLPLLSSVRAVETSSSRNNIGLATLKPCLDNFIVLRHCSNTYLVLRHRYHKIHGAQAEVQSLREKGLSSLESLGDSAPGPPKGFFGTVILCKTKAEAHAAPDKQSHSGTEVRGRQGARKGHSHQAASAGYGACIRPKPRKYIQTPGKVLL